MHSRFCLIQIPPFPHSITLGVQATGDGPNECSRCVVRDGAPAGIDSGRIARVQNRTYTTIDFPAVETGTVSINNLGQIVGGYVLPDGTRHDFLYSGGTYTAIDDPNDPASSEALGINSSAQIVGAYLLDSPEGEHTFEGAHACIYSGGIFTTLDYPAAGQVLVFTLTGNLLPEHRDHQEQMPGPGMYGLLILIVFQCGPQ